MSFSTVVKIALRLFRSEAKARWARFLRENYESVEEVAVEYDVTFQCAWNWWHEISKPEFSSACHAWSTRPESAAAHLSTGKKAA